MVSKTLGSADAIEIGRKLLTFPNLGFIETSEAVLFRAQSLVEKYSMRGRDASQRSAALSRNVNEIISDDRDLDVVNEIKRIPIA